MSKNARGKHETELLRSNINDQLSRLLTQLEDLEELKDEFEEEEYHELRASTVEQLKEFQTFLDRSVSGDMTLMDEFGAAQLAIQAAVSQAFKTPEVIRMFATGDADQLRKRLEMLRREMKLKKLSPESFNGQAVEILVALKKMGEELKPQEAEFLQRESAASKQLESAVSGLGSGAQKDLMSTASSAISRARN